MEEKKVKKKKIIKIILIFILFLIIFFGIIPLIKKTITQLFFSTVNKSLEVLRPDNIELSFDSIYSDSLKTNVTKFVTNYFKENKIENINLDEFDSILKQEFSFIKLVEWDFSFPGIAKLKIMGKNPVCVLNEKFMWADENSVLNLDNFKDYKFTYTKEFLSSKNLSLNIFNFLGKISPNIWENYKVNYEDKNNIFLMSKNKELFDNYLYLTNKKNILNETKLLYASKIFKELFINKKINKRKKYVLDLRYDKRILLKQGVAYDKKGI